MGLSYNGVTFPFCLTEDHGSRAVPDPSGTDVVYTETTIAVRGVLRAGDFPAVVGETLGATVARLTHLLTTPRRPLSYSVGNDLEFTVPNGDDANGPMPDAGAFRVEPLEGSFVVHFAVRTWRRLCTAGDARGFLSLKWSDQETDDLRGTKTRRRSGTLILSRQFTPNADDRRGLVIPALPPGFRRETADYTLSEDGLRLRFVFVDRQLHKGVPYPAVKVSGSMAETTPKNGIGARRGELTVRLEGRPGTSARDLLDAALRIGMGRVYASRPDASLTRNGAVLIGGGVRESLNDDETAVELNLAWTIHPNAARLDGTGRPDVITEVQPGRNGGPDILVIIPNDGRGRIDNQTPEGRPQAALAGDFGWLGLPFPGADIAQGVPTTTRGTGLAAAVRPLAAFLYDPCGQSGTLNQGPQPSEWVLTGASGTATLRSGAVAPTDQQAAYADPIPGVWDVWRMTYTFGEDSGYGVIPATKPDTAGELVRFGNQILTVRVEWELQRTGGEPPFPLHCMPARGGYTSDGSVDDNWVGRRAATTYSNLELAADGVSFVYAAAGWFELAALDPAKVAAGYPVPPWLAPAKKPRAGALAGVRPPAAAGQLAQPEATSTLQGVPNLSIPGVPPPDRP